VLITDMPLVDWTIGPFWLVWNDLLHV